MSFEHTGDARGKKYPIPPKLLLVRLVPVACAGKIPHHSKTSACEISRRLYNDIIIIIIDDIISITDDIIIHAGNALVKFHLMAYNITQSHIAPWKYVCRERILPPDPLTAVGMCWSTCHVSAGSSSNPEAMLYW